MQKIKDAIFLLLLLFISGCSETVTHLESQKGILDLRRFDIHTKPTPLVGEWEFYWNEFLDPRETPASGPYYLNPRPWNQIEIGGKTLPRRGFATYRLNVILSEPVDDLVLQIPLLHTAYRLYVDGDLIHENGKASTDPNIHKPSYKTQILSIKPKSNRFQIQLNISNYSHRICGMKEIIHLGKFQQINSTYQRKELLTLLGISWLAFLGAFNICLYYLRRDFKRSLYLGLSCFFVIVPIITLRDTRILFNLFSDEYCYTFIRLAFVSLPINLYLGGSVLYSVIADKRFKKTFFVFTCIDLLYGILMFVLPNYYLTLVSIPFEAGANLMLVSSILYLIFLAVKGNQEIRIFLISFFFAALIIVYESLFYYNYATKRDWLFFVGLSLFLLPLTSLMFYLVMDSLRMEEFAMRELVKSKEDLEQRVKDRTGELENANRWKTNLISLLSHDLQSPLIGLKFLLHNIQSRLSPSKEEEVDKLIQMGIGGVDNSIQLIRHLLSISRFDSDSVRLRYEFFSSADLFEYVNKEVEMSSSSKSINIILEDHHPGIIFADKTLLGEVICNLINNSIKFSHSDSEIILIHKRSDFKDRFYVKDFGMGMTEDQIHIFNTEGSDLQKKAGTLGEVGTGFGLSLSRSILGAHNGSITILSGNREGTEFLIQIPVGDKILLLVENSDLYRKETAEEFRKHNWLVVESSNGLDALSHLKQFTPHLLLTDVEMPALGGIELVHEWAAIADGRSLPILMMSSSAPLFSDQEFLKIEGIDEWVLERFSKLIVVPDLVGKVIECFESYQSKIQFK
ncbi:ATP-binding protein [Leptospira sp. 'Mane']|uniref:hybrid sensor histidine kinase/response regulator n=1 Tax=Leptospira sp. 'Mane' TaxID=3387407 RepID=UPI00398A9B0E